MKSKNLEKNGDGIQRKNSQKQRRAEKLEKLLSRPNKYADTSQSDDYSCNIFKIAKWVVKTNEDVTIDPLTRNDN